MAGRERLRTAVASRTWVAAALLSAVLLAGGGVPRPAAADEAPLAPPGSAPLPEELAARLWASYEAKGPGYRPRTEHLRADGAPLYVNRLILEDSPYLQQHAHNPVNWYPWGAEAFAAARREGKPIFLSIGYSTCHWCHVMEEESFDDEETARLLNEGFVAIKVDREQRPDVDVVYMTAVQLITGRGGWPMSSFLTSGGKPFFGGTYYPREQFGRLLRRITQLWRDQQPQLIRQAETLAERVALVTTTSGEVAEVGDRLLSQAVEESLSRHDDRLGGFSPAPKFPHEPELLFLLDRALRTDDRRALAAVRLSLDRMARGGIYDQVGGGFHRYSTDARWLVPHFEKMLYNQAHLGRAYLAAAWLTGNPFFERVARQTLDYVLRDMTSPDGAFYSATDADSEGAEGVFFLWTPKQIRAALPAADAELAMRVFGITEDGNFEGASILTLPEPLAAVAAGAGIPLSDLLPRIDGIRASLHEAREGRAHPLRDDKIVTAWNAMMITTLAQAGVVLEEERYRDAAVAAADSLWARNRREDGGLWRAHLDGASSVEASQNDYAYLVEALVTLYDLTRQPGFLERACEVADVMIRDFWDEAAGGFYLSRDDHGGRLPVRPKSAHDGAIPSGNSVAVRSLAMLAVRTGRSDYRRRAEGTIAAFSSQIRRQPTAFAYMLLGVTELLHGGAGPTDYGADGVVRAQVSQNADGASPSRRLTVRLDIADGWHVNSDQPAGEHLIATRLGTDREGLTLIDVRYPDAEWVTLGFQADPLSVFQGTTTIEADVESPEELLAIRLDLTVQACNDRQCLKPETLTLELPAGS